MIYLLKYNRLSKYYWLIIRKELIYKLNLTSRYNVPKISNISINNTDRKHSLNKHNIIYTVLGIKHIMIQKPVIILSKKPVAQLKIKLNTTLGVVSSIRSGRLFSFLDETIHTVLPKEKNIKKIKLVAIHNINMFNFGTYQLDQFYNIEHESYIMRQNTGVHLIIHIQCSSGLIQTRLLLNSIKIPIE